MACTMQFGGGAVRRLMKYLVLVAPVVVEGFPNKGTPDQLRVAMLYLLSEMPSLEPGLQNKLRPRQDRPQGRVPKSGLRSQ